MPSQTPARENGHAFQKWSFLAFQIIQCKLLESMHFDDLKREEQEWLQRKREKY
jgi:hypothetical protein